MPVQLYRRAPPRKEKACLAAVKVFPVNLEQTRHRQPSRSLVGLLVKARGLVSPSKTQVAVSSSFRGKPMLIASRSGLMKAVSHVRRMR